MEHQPPSRSLFPSRLSRAVATGKRHRRVVILVRLALIVALIGATAVWRHASADVVNSATNLSQTATTSPQSVSVGSQAAITVTTAVTQSAVSNGIIDIEVYDANNTKVGQQFFSGQNIAPGQSVTQTYSWTASTAGTYRVAVGVFAANWSSLLSWTNNAGTITVGTASPTSGPAVLSQTTTVNGTAPANITTTISDASGAVTSGIIDIELYDANNTKVGQQFFTGQSLSAGQALTHSIAWTAPSAGTYRVVVGVFSGDWSTVLFWANNAATITVGAPPTSTSVPPTSTPVPPTSTPVPPTSTAIPPTSTAVPPTSTAVPPTSTSVPSTGMKLTQTTSVQGSSPANITASISDVSGSIQNGIIDIEIYNSANQKVSQYFYDGQNLASGQVTTHSVSWTPSTSGTYRVAVGVFTANWGSLLLWSNNAATIAVSSSPATPVPPTATSIPPTSTRTPSTSGCQFQKADQPLNIAFCDTFDTPAGTGNRSGDLNGLFWGVSRTTQNVNVGQGIYDGWFPVNRQTCGATQLVQPEHDIAICNGQMVEAVNDGHENFTTLAAYVTQPFDIAGRTGTVVFDVSADSEGPHAAWPSFIYTDQPVPAPTGNHTTTNAYAQNSFGFALDADPASCGGGNMTGVGETFATSSYVYRALTFTPVNNCITYQAGQLNHFEVRISQSRVEIWGTNVGSTTLQELGYVANAGLTLSRGLVWLEDQHYNACKFNDQCTHTFVWDNVGFDGPTLPRDLHLDANDALTADSDGSYSLGWYAPDPSLGTPLSLHVPGATDLAQASGALLTLNFFPYNTLDLQYRLNGHAWHSLAWPYPDNTTYVWRTIAIPVSLSELQAGTNTVDLEATNGGTTVANIDLILVGAQGIVPYAG